MGPIPDIEASVGSGASTIDEDTEDVLQRVTGEIEVSLRDIRRCSTHNRKAMASPKLSEAASSLRERMPYPCAPRQLYAVLESRKGKHAYSLQRRENAAVVVSCSVAL